MPPLTNRQPALLHSIRIPTAHTGEGRAGEASLLEIDDSFQKIVLVRDVVKPVRDEHGILTMSVYDFLLDSDSLTM